MKSILFIIAVALLGSPAFSQNQEVKDEKAVAVLNRLSKKFKTAKTVHCNFSYRLENKDQGIDEVQSGTFKLKGTKYHILLKEYEIVSNGITRWLYMKEVGEVQIEHAKVSEEAEELMNPSKIFSLHEKGFKYKHIGKKLEDGKMCDIIKLFPEKASEKPYHSITIYVDATDLLHKAKIDMKDGNKYTYTLNKVTLNIEIAESSFTFDVSKAGEVIDLR